MNEAMMKFLKNYLQLKKEIILFDPETKLVTYPALNSSSESWQLRGAIFRLT
jgi:hypothetical protein